MSKTLDTRTFHSARRERSSDRALRMLQNIGWVASVLGALLLIILLLAGCGKPIEVTYHFDTPRDTLQAMAGTNVPPLGFATWKDKLTPDAAPHVVEEQCDIYLAPRSEFPSDACWDYTIAHENMHCTAHDFHPPTPDGMYVPACSEDEN